MIYLQDDDDNMSVTPMMDMTYCHIVGSVRSYNQKRNIMILTISPVTDLNRLTTHLLEVIHMAFHSKKIEQMVKFFLF